MVQVKNIRILFVEDMPEDVEIAKRTISREGIAFDYVVVDTEPDFIRALKEFKPDLVVSDYSMPEFDGMRALKITRSQKEYKPFIVLTGSMNEETAVACMKAGANDYVIKESIKRLPYAIRETIEKDRERKDKERIEKSQEFIHYVSQLPTSTLSLREYIIAIHEELQKIMRANNFYIVLYDKEIDKYTAPYFRDEYDDFTTDEPISLKGTLTDYVRKTRKAMLIIPDIEEELRKKEKIVQLGKSSKVWLGAPLIDSSTQEVTGIIGLQDYNDENAYEQRDLDTLKIIAANIGIFIERIKNLEKLRNSESRFISFLNSTTDIVQLEDEEHRMLFVNKALLNNLGITKEEAVGKTVFDLFPKNVAKNCHISDKLALKKGEIIRGEEKWDDRVFETLKFPVVLGDGKTGVGAFIRDITEKKKLMEDLISAKEKAEESERLKTAFLANMSHEIRTPMNGILGFTNLLKETEYNSEEKKHFIDIIEKSGQRMLNTLNNIIEISRIESGNVALNLSEINFNEKIEEIVSFFEAEASDKGLKLSIDRLLPADKTLITTDHVKIESIITNFIKNAVKYTSQGSINVGCTLKNSVLEFYVKDTGMGIPKNRQEAIFNRFEQADINDRMALEGAGLGLAISKSYIELLGGKIYVESEEGKGSAFYFILPLK